jgi:hypothetical protein
LRKPEGPYLDRLKIDSERQKKQTDELFAPLIKLFGDRLWMLPIAVLVLTVFFGWLGEQVARAQSLYPTFNYQGRAWAIVRAYGDRWIVREVNYSTGSFEKAYAVMLAQPVVLNETKVSK